MKKLKENPKLDPGGFRDEICRTLRCKVSMSKAYRARRKALDLLHGSNVEQYGLLGDYCNEIERCNPGTSLSLKLIDDEESGVQRFQRIYVFLSACKRGFLEGCRLVVGVDGCWLKDSFGGQLLSVVGIDANHNIFPIVYAMVEVENKDSWLWFLERLKRDLDIEDGHNWTFMSDKQKGLIPAFESILPQAENRFCVRHLHTNMKRDGYTGIVVKRLLWAAAKATTIPEFKRRMEEMKKASEDFYYEAKDKPIISMLEKIRNLLMVRMQLNREKAEKLDDSLCLKIMKIMKKRMEEASEFIPMRSDDWNFQITGSLDQHTVNVRDRICSCRKWDFTYIPCKHAVSAIWCR
ncbi:uncharacterized protein LOC127252829 [Andrographis paniculata]|uniref:uncharacterized protein LOC127252829 n=1 Tax=Andrographis paniculata TaxID=175694 RepID=UPI0021E749C0|nr:uncharacterized protein LOC127252829 [Andrographis paniculata]